MYIHLGKVNARVKGSGRERGSYGSRSVRMLFTARRI